MSLSTTGHSTASSGVETQAGSPAATLVGMIRTNASSQFVDSFAQRFCLNWFNRRSISAMNSFSASRATSSSTQVELSSTERAEFLSWADESALLSFSASAYQNTSTGSFSSSITLDGVASGQGSMVINSAISGSPQSVTAISPFSPSEGYHYATVLGAATTGFTATWLGTYATIAAMTRG